MIDMPVFATRPTADGTVGAYYLNPYVAFTIFVLIMLNIIGWSIVGLVALLSKLVTLIG